MDRKSLQRHPLLRPALEICIGNHAEDLQLLGIKGLHKSLYDYLLIGTCRSETHMRALLGKLRKSLKGAGNPTIKQEYETGSKWGLLDCGELIVHLFETDTRKFYSLDRLWSDAQSIPIHREDFVKDEAREEVDDEFL